MKTKKFEKKLSLNKKTIVHLNRLGMDAAKGGKNVIIDPTFTATLTAPMTCCCSIISDLMTCCC
jgi:hypothetical protein